MAADYANLILKCEDALRAGNALPVGHWLQGINTARVPRKYRSSLANICRRANLFSMGLRILTPCVREGSADSAELAEYAVLLERCGAVEEAHRVLRDVNTQEVPGAYLYRAFCHFKSWDYASAIPDLRAYANTPLAPYQALIARVNLAAAFIVTGDFDNAQKLLQENISLARAQKFSRLNANCLELSAQIHFHRRDYGAASRDLRAASRILGGERTSDQLFVLKWQRILEAFEKGETGTLEVLRREAIKRDDGESVREADLFRLMIRRDAGEFNHLYVGTPFAAYRERVRRELNCSGSEEKFRFGAPTGPVLDMRTGIIEGAAAVMKPGKKIHQFLRSMLRDFYRPARIGSLFAELYPGENFDIFTSPARVHQVLFRTRQWLEENRIPVKITEKNQAYTLNVEGPFAFAVAPDENCLNGYSAQFSLVESAMGVEFTGRQVCAVLDFSPATCKRILKWAVESGKLRRQGAVYSRTAAS